MNRCFHILLICQILLCPLTCPLAAFGIGTDSSEDREKSCCSHCAVRNSEECPEIPPAEDQVCQCFCSQAYTVQTVEEQSFEADLWSLSPLLDMAGVPTEIALTDESSLHFVWESPPLSICDGRSMRLWICSLTC